MSPCCRSRKELRILLQRRPRALPSLFPTQLPNSLSPHPPTCLLLGVRHLEPRVLGAHGEIRKQRPIGAASCCIAVHLGDRGLWNSHKRSIGCRKSLVCPCHVV